jgi:hypothetical protein
MLNLTVMKHAMKATAIMASSVAMTTIVSNVMGKKFGEEVVLAYKASKKEEEAK